MFYKDITEFLAEEVVNYDGTWAVSDWFADQLKSRGETIRQTYFGSNIWIRKDPESPLLKEPIVKQIWLNLKA